MIERFDPLGFTLQGCYRSDILHQYIRENFDADQPFPLLIPGKPYGSTSASPEGTDQDEPCRETLPAFHHDRIVEPKKKSTVCRQGSLAARVGPKPPAS